MFRLRATLVATTLMRPWRTGWSVDRGVDFSFSAATGPLAVPPTSRPDPAAAERACFIDEDWPAPADLAAVRTFVSAVAAEAAPECSSEEGTKAPALRAWWSLAGKPSRT